MLVKNPAVRGVFNERPNRNPREVKGQRPVGMSRSQPQRQQYRRRKSIKNGDWIEGAPGDSRLLSLVRADRADSPKNSQGHKISLSYRCMNLASWSGGIIL